MFVEKNLLLVGLRNPQATLIGHPGANSSQIPASGPVTVRAGTPRTGTTRAGTPRTVGR